MYYVLFTITISLFDVSKNYDDCVSINITFLHRHHLHQSTMTCTKSVSWCSIFCLSSQWYKSVWVISSRHPDVKFLRAEQHHQSSLRRRNLLCNHRGFTWVIIIITIIIINFIYTAPFVAWNVAQCGLQEGALNQNGRYLETGHNMAIKMLKKSEQIGSWRDYGYGPVALHELESISLMYPSAAEHRFAVTDRGSVARRIEVNFWGAVLALTREVLSSNRPTNDSGLVIIPQLLLWVTASTLRRCLLLLHIGKIRFI